MDISKGDRMIYHQLYFDSRKNRLTAVFLHAFPLNLKMWGPQFEVLREKNIPYLALDYPGFGMSAPWEKEPSMDDFAEEAYRAIDRLNLQRVIVVGLSMGGYVALSLFRKHPDIFNGLVLANTRATADTEEGRQKRFKLIDEISKDPSMNGLIQLHLGKFFTEETRVSEPQLLVLAESLMKEASPQGVIRALQAMAGRADSMDLLKGMNFPVLVVAGGKDPLMSLEDAQAMKDGAQNAELSVISNAAHLSNLEKPEEFNENLIRFISNL
jgi:3-oxoadipate enol-lactonase